MDQLRVGANFSNGKKVQILSLFSSLGKKDLNTPALTLWQEDPLNDQPKISVRSDIHD